MNLYISGSNRKQNCYKVLKDLISEEDKLISLSEMDIKFCLGCNECGNKLDEFCVIEDGMSEIYSLMLKADKIILGVPIYFNQVSGMFKNIIDRLNPFCTHNSLESKKIYLITLGCQPEKDNKDVVKNINGYFNELAEILGFEFTYLRNFTTEKDDDIEANYDGEYNTIIAELKQNIDK